MNPPASFSDPIPDLERLGEAVLALLRLTAFTEKIGTLSVTRDWDAQSRLHEQGWIENPVGKAKSVTFTEEGRERAQALFERLFYRPADLPPTP